MRRLPLLLAAVPVLAAACASLVGFPDVPDVGDGGASDGSGSDDGLGSRSGRESGSTSGESNGGSGLDSGGSNTGSGSSGSSAGSAAGASSGSGPGSRSGGTADAGPNTPGCSGSQLSCAGACVPNDVHHCGACGHDCTGLPHVTGSVSCNGTGQCSLVGSSCAVGWAHCTTNPDDGCETDITQATRCGSCSSAC